MTADTIVLFFASLTVLGQALLLVGLVAILGRNSFGRRLYAWMGSFAIRGAFIVALVAMIGSLLFSEVAHFTPCVLCWYQRIAMYPQVILLGLALSGKNRDVIWQSIVLSGIGAVIAIYHYYLQLGGPAIAPCSVGSGGTDCALKVAFTFGYITIPVMALTGFLMILLAMLVRSASDRRAAITN